MSDAFRKEITVEAQEKDRDSILAFYKKLIAMRKTYPVIAKGNISFLETGTDLVLAYRRTLGEQSITVFCNLDGKEQKMHADGARPGRELTNGCQVLLGNYHRDLTLEGPDYIMKPYEIIVLGNVWQSAGGSLQNSAPRSATGEMISKCCNTAGTAMQWKMPPRT